MALVLRVKEKLGGGGWTVDQDDELLTLAEDFGLAV